MEMSRLLLIIQFRYFLFAGSAILRAERISEAYQGADNSSSKPGIGGAIRDIPLSLKVLLTNPTFMFLNMAGASEGRSSTKPYHRVPHQYTHTGTRYRYKTV